MHYNEAYTLSIDQVVDNHGQGLDVPNSPLLKDGFANSSLVEAHNQLLFAPDELSSAFEKGLAERVASQSRKEASQHLGDGGSITVVEQGLIKEITLNAQGNRVEKIIGRPQTPMLPKRPSFTF